MYDWRGPGGPIEHDPDELPALRADLRSPLWRTVVEIPLLLGFAAVIAIVIKTFVAQAFYIPSASMEPQLAAGDRVVVSRIAYDLHEPNRGDIVVFDDPLEPEAGGDSFLLVRAGREALEAIGVIRPDDKELIKRVVGLPGETVSARGGTVYIGDRPLTEPYLPDDVLQSDFPPTLVPEDHVFVLGDNRSNSKDSRVFRAVPVDSIVGRAIARVWPPGRVAFL